MQNGGRLWRLVRVPARHPSAQSNCALSKTGTQICALNFCPTFDLRHATDSTDYNLRLYQTIATALGSLNTRRRGGPVLEAAKQEMVLTQLSRSALLLALVKQSSLSFLPAAGRSTCPLCSCSSLIPQMT